LLADPLGRSNAGRGYVFYNAANLRGLNFDLDDAQPGVIFSRIDGPLANAIGSDTALQGDFDGDGIGDLGIGNPHDGAPIRPDSGSLYILYGQPGGWPTSPPLDLNLTNLPGSEVMRIALIQGAHGTSGSDRGDILCYSAASGDINGDGRLDLIVNEMAGNAVAGTEDVGNMIVIDSTSLLAAFQPSLEASLPGPIDFGSVQVGTGSTMRSVTFTNNGGSLVNIASLAVGGPTAADFAVTSDSGETTLGPGDSRAITVTFDPSFVGRFGGALVLATDSDPHPVALGLAGRGVDDAYAVPSQIFHLVGRHAVVEVQSRFGTDYGLTRTTDLGAPPAAPLFTVPGTGQTLYLTDPNALDAYPRAYYRLRVRRN